MTYDEIKSLLSQALAERKNHEKLKASFDGQIRRVGRIDETDPNSDIFVFAKGKKRYGNRLEDYIKKYNIQFSIIISEPKTDPAIAWRKGWEKVIKKLEISQLWPELLKEKQLSLQIGYEKINSAASVYWRDNPKPENYAPKDEHDNWYYENQRINALEIQKIDPRLVSLSPSGDVSPKTEILWHTSHVPKIKKMNFGKYSNQEKLREIHRALQTKTKFHTTGRTSYDVSFSYDPAIQKAWYSEEFKNCGNGHYYLALDATHALFYEDD